MSISDVHLKVFSKDKYVLIEDLPFAQEGSKVLREDLAIIDFKRFNWYVVKACGKCLWIGNQSYDMQHIIKKIETKTLSEKLVESLFSIGGLDDVSRLKIYLKDGGSAGDFTKEMLIVRFNDLLKAEGDEYK